MFFNEDLYLEGDDAAKAAAPEMTQDEIKEAVEEAKEDDLASKIEEGKDFELYALKEMSKLNESYFNLREKMMMCEHVASLKAAQGLVSESEMILEASASEFLDKLKKFFINIGKVIKALFNRFVEFIMGLTVSANKIKTMNVNSAFEQYSKNRKAEDMKVKVFNFKSDVMMNAATYGTAMLAALDACIGELKKVYSECGSSSASYDTFTATFDKFVGNSNRPKKLIDRAKASKNNVEAFVSSQILSGEGNATAAITKNEVPLTADLLKDRQDFVISYSNILTKVKAAKKSADDAVKDGVKAIDTMTKEPTETQRKAQSKIISTLRWCGSNVNACFSKLISILSQYYRESMAILRRVAGGNVLADAKAKAKSMTEGFDYASYFESAF